jgi:hypothetical protein
LQEIMDMPDKGLQDDLLSHVASIGSIPLAARSSPSAGSTVPATSCIPGIKARVPGSALGVLHVRRQFRPPAGRLSTDYVLLVRNFDGIKALLEDKVTFGADASVTTDAQMTTKVLSSSRSKGLFTDIALDGAALPSGNDNKDIYGREVSPRAMLVEDSVAPPAAAGPLLQLLRNYSATRTEKPL